MWKKNYFQVASLSVEIRPAESAAVRGNTSRGRGLVHADKKAVKPRITCLHSTDLESLGPAAQHVGGSLCESSASQFKNIGSN